MEQICHFLILKRNGNLILALKIHLHPEVGYHKEDILQQVLIDHTLSARNHSGGYWYYSL